MEIVIVTGSGGLVGSEAARFYARRADVVVGVDNNMRASLFGDEASTSWVSDGIDRQHDNYRHAAVDIRSTVDVERLFAEYGSDIRLVVHTAAQPSHDWAARDPSADFGINAVGTQVLLEATRAHCPEAVFIFTSTNKVYGDRPNTFGYIDKGTRWELDPSSPYAARGFDESLPVDQSTHSLFGASKLAADILVQEYGRYFGLRTGSFRGGCLTGPSHAGTQLHGFLAYLMKCAATGEPYTVFGHEGKQVRDNLHAADLIDAFDAFYRAPRGGEVYNIGGGRRVNCSMLEAIEWCERISGNRLEWSYDPDHRTGDHRWWISDTTKFAAHYDWVPRHSVPEILQEIHDAGMHRWRHAS